MEKIGKSMNFFFKIISVQILLVEAKRGKGDGMLVKWKKRGVWDLLNSTPTISEINLMIGEEFEKI